MKTYTVTINGIEHSMQLSDEDAKRLGVEESTSDSKSSTSSKSSAPANKSRS